MDARPKLHVRRPRRCRGAGGHVLPQNQISGAGQPCVQLRVLGPLAPAPARSSSTMFLRLLNITLTQVRRSRISTRPRRRFCHVHSFSRAGARRWLSVHAVQFRRIQQRRGRETLEEAGVCHRRHTSRGIFAPFTRLHRRVGNVQEALLMRT